MSLTSLCVTHRIKVERSGISQDSSGGLKRETWTPVTGMESLSCTLQPLSSKERMTFAQRQIYLTHRCYLPGKWTILRNDRLVLLNEDGTDSKRKFIILGVFDQAGRGSLTAVECVEQTD